MPKLSANSLAHLRSVSACPSARILAFDPSCPSYIFRISAASFFQASTRSRGQIRNPDSRIGRPAVQQPVQLADRQPFEHTALSEVIALLLGLREQLADLGVGVHLDLGLEHLRYHCSAP